MINTEFEKELNEVIIKTFEILREPTNTESRLVFPNYSSGKKRVSEQELRFVFVEQIKPVLEKYGYYFSVETPTKDKYSFSNKNQGKKKCESGKGRSANFDLTIKGQDGKTNIAIIEFKANSASDHECAKDICKLWNNKEEGSFRYFLNLFRTMDKETHDTLIRKLSPDKNKFLLSPKNKIKVHVIAQSSNKSEEEYYYDGSV